MLDGTFRRVAAIGIVAALLVASAAQSQRPKSETPRSADEEQEFAGTIAQPGKTSRYSAKSPDPRPKAGLFQLHS